ncbi:hypothetical protein BJ875DRAFT_113787 [Amylocarpus encephaloides]|uniref:Secreted protein n=1 Tax=Amylocarpus encephaloides TaxID=45428 RepID=A0A9P7YQK0_9HELO|nr:hypothetical protein BJ875DRAFT_113787 [Amylocarpus encephaloides]
MINPFSRLLILLFFFFCSMIFCLRSLQYISSADSILPTPNCQIWNSACDDQLEERSFIDPRYFKPPDCKTRSGIFRSWPWLVVLRTKICTCCSTRHGRESPGAMC